jgi:oligoendopeptidase F
MKITTGKIRLVTMTAAVVLALAALPPAYAEEASEPEVIAWDLSDMYATPEAWTADREALLAMLPKLESYQGRLGKSAKTLLKALEAAGEAEARLGRLFVYAGLKSDEDLRISENQERRSMAGALLAQYSQAVSYFSPEILSVGGKKIEAFIAREPGLAKHAFGLRDILRQAPHTLGNEAEELMAMVSEVRGGPSRVYRTLASSDIKWPTITLSTGEEVTLNQAAYTRYRAEPDRADRKAVFDAFWGKWTEYENTMGQMLDAQVKTHIFDAKARKYSNALESSMSGSNIPKDVYYALIEAVNEGLPAFHRYLKIRQRVLGLDDLHYYDIYPALVQLDKTYTLDDAKTLTLAAAIPLGQEYIDMLEIGFAEDWMHVFPQTGKRPGAYQWGVYEVHPYLLLNFNSDYESVSTFAHEWGHGVHTMLAGRAQTRENAGYSTFTAELASTTTEVFLNEDLMGKATSDDERLYLLGMELESIRGTFYRQTMFAEFELKIHQAVENGEALSGERMSEIYLGLLRRYHGADEGVMEIDPLYAIEWAYIPHFYRNFYVYQYATSISGGVQFAERILAGEKGAAESYLNVLKAGGSEYPYALLKEAGIDLATKAPYQALISRMNGIMDEIEAILEKR